MHNFQAKYDKNIDPAIRYFIDILLNFTVSHYNDMDHFSGREHAVVDYNGNIWSILFPL